MTIAIHGLGYIGLPTALEFANAGFDVVGIDVNAETVSRLNAGDVHIFEAGLKDWYDRVRSAGHFRATTKASPADVHFIAVPTPIRTDKTADMDAVRQVAETIGRVLKPGDLVVLVSTSPPRTCLDLIAPILQSASGLSPDEDFDLAHCPERVLPGAILREFKENHRIVGGTTERATQRTLELYGCVVDPKRLHGTDATTAELCKVMENTYRDVNIALANEILRVSERLGVDPREAIELANLHPRVNYLSPGIGVGGHCIPVDPWFLVEAAPDLTPLIQTARRTNDARPHEVVEQILDNAAVGPIALFGLAFKPDVDDLRESPAVEIAELLAQHEDEPILVVEPFISSLPPSLKSYENVRLVGPVEALQAPTVVALVAHSAFRSLDPYGGRKVLDFAGAFAKP